MQKIQAIKEIRTFVRAITTAILALKGTIYDESSGETVTTVHVESIIRVMNVMGGLLASKHLMERLIPLLQDDSFEQAILALTAEIDEQDRILENVGQRKSDLVNDLIILRRIKGTQADQ